MTRRYSLAHLTALHLDPPALIRAAARAGFDAVGLRLLRVTEDSPGYPLMDDAAALARTRAALAETGLAVQDIEFVKITPETQVQALLPLLDAGAALGARHVITAPYDPDLSRLAATLGALSEAAQERGLSAVLEFFPWTVVPDLASCWRVVQAAGDAVGILPDALHFDRSGSDLALLRALPPQRLPFAHLCDAQVQPSYSTEALLHTARQDRLPPGAGQIDLRGFLDALPPGTPLGLEVPLAGGVMVHDTDGALRTILQAAQRLGG
ncbi:MAG: TIM barrel protein [Roseivivax sp.]|nr:TIM barrel protein [Roseivivax sp.]